MKINLSFPGKNLRASLLFVFFLCGYAFADAGPFFPGQEWKSSPPQDAGLDLDHLREAVEVVEEISREDGTQQMVIIYKGKIVWSGDRVDEPQRIWSCTKSFLSVCFGLLWDDGKVTPDTLAADIMPELAELYPEVTLEHLGTFTSGYTFEDKQRLVPLPPLHSPGAAYHYNRQSDLLAALLTIRAGRPLEDLFRERIAEPLGITEDCMTWESFDEINGIPVTGGSGAPGASVLITPLAMARFGWLFANNGVWEGERLISQRYIDYATVPQTERDLPPHNPEGWYTILPGNYGFKWWTNGPRPDGTQHWPSAPERTFAAQGNRNNNCFIVPEWDLVVVRLGQDRAIDMRGYDAMFRLLGEAREKTAQELE